MGKGSGEGRSEPSPEEVYRMERIGTIRQAEKMVIASLGALAQSHLGWIEH